jgi:hypothetical protein
MGERPRSGPDLGPLAPALASAVAPYGKVRATVS